MNDDTTQVGNLRPTTLDPTQEKVVMSAWITPVTCEGCDSRVDTFYRYNRHDDALCSGCGHEWEIIPFSEVGEYEHSPDSESV